MFINFYLILNAKDSMFVIGRGIRNVLLDDEEVLMFLMRLRRSEAFPNPNPLRSQLLLVKATKLFTYTHPNNLDRQVKRRSYFKLGKAKLPSRITSLSSMNYMLKGLKMILWNYYLIFKFNSLLLQSSNI
jgi:hypothetical protein